MNEVEIRKMAFRRVVLSLSLLLFLLVASNSFTAAITGYTERVEVSLYHDGETTGDRYIGIDNIKSLASNYDEVSYSKPIDTYILGNNYTLPVRAELTDSGFMRFSGLKMEKGTYFREDAYMNGRNVAVISGKLAERLFMNKDVIGNEVHLLGEKYSVIGVYDSSWPVISFASDGLERVYIPYTSHSQDHMLPIETIYINDHFLKESKFREELVSRNIKIVLNIAEKRYKVTDYYDQYTIACQWKDIAVFFTAIWCICLVAGFFTLFIRKAASYTRSCMKDIYPGEFIRSRYLYLLGFIAGAAIIAGFAVFIYLVARPSILIPARYIPQNNIFDLKFYAEIIKSMIYESNSIKEYIPTQFEKFCRTACLLNLISLLCAIPILFSMVYSLKLMKLAGTGAGTYIKAIAASSVLAAVATILFSMIGGLILKLPLKSISVILTFYLLKAYDKQNLGNLLDSIQHVRMNEG